MLAASLFAAAVPNHAQSESTPAAESLRTVLSDEEFRRAGLNKLTEEELAFLSHLLLESGVSRAAALEAPPDSAGAAKAFVPATPPELPSAAISKETTDAVGPDEPARSPPSLTQGADGEAAFGREDALRREAERARNIPTSIESEISGTFRGWDGHTTFTLTNGQVWQQIEDGTFSVRLQNPQVTIEKAALGAFYLRVEGYGSRVKVRRIK